MPSSRVWTDGGTSGGMGGYVRFRVEIRDVATETIQDSAIIEIANYGGISG
jgi:hypothetical protein